MITCVPSSKSYAWITVDPVWETKRGSKYELNVSSSYLTTRPLEEVVASMIHEACHLLNIVHGVPDTSNNGVYHNKQFKRTAEEHGLIVTRSDKYGWSHTAPGDPVLQFVLDHMDELREIEINKRILLHHPEQGNYLHRSCSRREPSAAFCDTADSPSPGQGYAALLS